MRQIAIVGGGPAGAMCGQRLASAGFDVTIYDEHLAWEKPCGGGLTHKAVVAYPFLFDSPYAKKLVQTVELISSRRPSRAPRPRSSHRHLLAQGAQWLAAGAGRGSRLPGGAVARGPGGHQRVACSLACGRGLERSRFRGDRRGRAQRLAAWCAASGAPRPRNDRRLLHPGASRRHSREIPQALRGLHLVVPARRPSFGRHLRQHVAPHHAGVAPTAGTIPQRRTHLGKGRELVQPRSAVAATANASRASPGRAKLGAGGRRGCSGRSDHRRGPLLRVALRRPLGRDARSPGRRRDIPSACAPISPWISNSALAWRDTCMPAASWVALSQRAWCSSSAEARRSAP